MAFFGVKLSTENIILFNSGNKFIFESCFGQDIPGGSIIIMIGMQKIKFAFIFNAL